MSLNQLNLDFPQPQKPLLRWLEPRRHHRGPPSPPALTLPRVPTARELGAGELRTQGGVGAGYQGD